jgi:putative peptide zinc metalloprotease protein
MAAASPDRRSAPAADDQSSAPELTPRLEFLGEYRGSGCHEPPYLLRRADGQMVALSRLVYFLAEEIRGGGNLTQIAVRLTTRLGRGISPSSVDFLIQEKLVPLGVVVTDDALRSPRTPPVLALSPRLRGVLLPQRVVDVAAGALSHLFRAPVVLAVLAGLCAFDVWFFFHHGVGEGAHRAASEPGLVVLVYVVVMLSATFHELGHAAGGRYGGARPGRIGLGLFLIWPALFSDMTDSYRLDRKGRLRADLGGVYFNAVFILGSAAVYWITGFEPILATIVVQHLLALYQLFPLLRLDGYYIVGDLIGVPDLYAKVRPVFESLVPGRAVPPAVRELRPVARALVTAWVIVTVPLLVGVTAVFVIQAPSLYGALCAEISGQITNLRAAVNRADLLLGVVAAVQLAVLSLVPLGLGLVVVRQTQRVRRTRRERSTARHRSPVVPLMGLAKIGADAPAGAPHVSAGRSVLAYIGPLLIVAIKLYAQSTAVLRPSHVHRRGMRHLLVRRVVHALTTR